MWFQLLHYATTAGWHHCRNMISFPVSFFHGLTMTAHFIHAAIHYVLIQPRASESWVVGAGRISSSSCSWRVRSVSCSLTFGHRRVEWLVQVGLHHVPEGLGVFPVPWPSRWSWSLHLFLGRPMFLRPFGLYFSACFGSLFVSILCTCCSHFIWYCFISFMGAGKIMRYTESKFGELWWTVCICMKTYAHCFRKEWFWNKTRYVVFHFHYVPNSICPSSLLQLLCTVSVLKLCVSCPVPFDNLCVIHCCLTSAR